MGALGRLAAVVLAVWAADGPLVAADSLGVGYRARGGVSSWTRALASSELVSFSPDSVWMWDVAANANLGPGIPQRNGFLLFSGAATATFVEGAEVMYDGDLETAFDPDEFTETTDIERNSVLYIDLGSTFRVNRIRMSPRLDADNRNRFLRAFSLATNDGLADSNITQVRYESVFNFFETNPNREPVLERRFESREVRYIRIQPRAEQAWEIAELEVYSDGTVPVGEVVSFPLPAPTGARPLWGHIATSDPWLMFVHKQQDVWIQIKLNILI